MGDIIREIYPDQEALARNAAAFIVGKVRAKPGRIALCLCGGTTPRRLYQLLATAEWRDQIPWDRLHWFWGDERFVPASHPQSNYGMTRQALFAAIPTPGEMIHPVPTDLASPGAAAESYQRTLREWYGAATLDPARPLFDITLLGLGEDGHTASLFPGDPALAERSRWVVPVPAARPEPRVTLTLPVLNASQDSVFLVAGEAKHPVLQRIAAGEDLPAARVTATGRLIWMLDRSSSQGATASDS
jgi:6-phosphogluconolactonase